MKTTTRLHTGWRLHHCNWRTGHTVDFSTCDPDDGWIDAAVPGEIHLDCLREGMIPDPFFGTNNDHCLWMEEKDWWYRLEFQRPEWQPGQRVFLDFEGLDTFATVYLNGEEIGRHANMFTPLRIDMTEKLVPGANTLAVCFASPRYEVKVSRSPELFGTPPERLFARKAQSCYGWDIAPRIVTCGIWRPVALVVTDVLEIADADVTTLRIEGNKAVMRFSAGILNHGDTPQPVVLHVTAGKQTLDVSCDCPPGRCDVKHEFVIPDPRLWWPRGHGEQALYDFEVKVARDLRARADAARRSASTGAQESDDPLCDRIARRFGIRTVELVQEPQPSGATSFRFEVNGKPVFLKGMNWTPADAIFPRADEARYVQLVGAAADANINAMRVLGGGIYEPDVFYDLCDRQGILLWQDFMFACACYPQEEAFLAEVREEAEHVVRRLRGHPCLLARCGDNENDWLSTFYGVPDYRHNPTTKKVLPDVVCALSPEIPYVPSSPFSPKLEDQNSDLEGDVHLWNHAVSHEDEFYAGRRPRMVTEMGRMALPAMEVIRSFVPEEDLWPILNDTWRMHCADPNRVIWDDWRLKDLFKCIIACGREEPGSLEEMIRVTQDLQVEATRAWIRQFSSDPECWGLFLWNLADCWPQVSSACIDYPFRPKPVLQTVKDEYRRIER